MSLLIVAAETNSQHILVRAETPDEIARELSVHGVSFARWTLTSTQFTGTENSDAILHAYSAEISRVQQKGNLPAVDVVRMIAAPDDPAWCARAAAARGKFLQEHTHGEDEVRFFVEGAGVFYLHIDARVYMLLCTGGDLLSVPAGMKHWFDMGEVPHFCAIRFFGTAQGWVASFTGDAIATKFPTFEAVRAQQSDEHRS